MQFRNDKMPDVMSSNGMCVCFRTKIRKAMACGGNRNSECRRGLFQ